MTNLGKKGVVSPPMAVGILICAALVIILIWVSMQAIIQAAILGQSSYIATDIGLTMEAAYAAPENLEVSYEFPIDDEGFPAAGTLVINPSESKIGISRLSEDDMWMEISNKAMSAWGAGLAIKAAEKTRKAVRKYSTDAAWSEARGLQLAINKEELLTRFDNYDILYAPKNAPKLGDISRAAFNSQTKGVSEAYTGVLADQDALNIFRKFQADDTLRTAIRDPPTAKAFFKISKESPRRYDFIIKHSPGLDQNVKDALIKNKNLLEELHNSRAAQDFLELSEELSETVSDSGRKVYSGLLDVADVARRGEDGWQSFLAAQQTIGELRGGEFLNKLGSPAAEDTLKAIQKNKPLRTIIADQANAQKFGNFLSDRSIDMQTLGQLSDRKLNKLMNLVEADKIDAAKALAREYGLADTVVDTASGLHTDFPKIAKQLKTPSKMRRAAGAIFHLPRLKDARVNHINLKQVLKNPKSLGILIDISKGAGTASEFSKTFSSWWKVSRLRAVLSIPAKAAHTLKTGSANLKNMFVGTKEAPTIMGKGMRAIGDRVRAANVVSSTQDFFKNVGLKIVGKFSKGISEAATKKAVVAPLAVVAESETPVGWGARIAAGVLNAVFFIWDFSTISYPIIMLVRIGHETSQTTYNKIVWYSYASSTTSLSAYPPNCMPGADRDPLWDTAKEDVFGFIFGGLTFNMPSPTCTDQSITIAGIGTPQVNTCLSTGGSCPNLYISDTTFANWPTLGGTLNIFGIDIIRLDSLPANLVLGGFSMFCSSLSILIYKPAILGLVAPIVCYTGFYSALVGAYAAAPGPTADFMLGSAILPRDRYYYIQYPSEISFSKDYNAETGETSMEILSEE